MRDQVRFHVGSCVNQQRRSTQLTGRAYTGSIGSKWQRPMSDRPAMPKKVWYTSAMSSGRSEMPPACSSCTPTYFEEMPWSLQAQAP